MKAVKEKEQLLRENYTNDCERLQKHLIELKKNALQNDADFDEIRKVGELLTEAKKKKAQLREPLSETEIIAALGDISGLWEFMFPGTIIDRTSAAGEILPPFLFRGLYLTAKMVYYKCEVFYE